ncbi:MAG: DUF499 domain-containing protein [Verrucomicrobia bacterium]|nr:DUF499 domain-containing protein [Verrucomicrobiota bacterium]MCH8512257.1 DUF499 domain-containing protein [Kiritimatiellia bacterium]
MAKSNRTRIDEALHLLRSALAPYIEREMRTIYKTDWVTAVRRGFGGHDHQYEFEAEVDTWDTQACLAVMNKFWGDVFRRTLGFAERSYVSEIWEVRKAFAHDHGFSSADTFRALDTMSRLCRAVSAPEAKELEAMAEEVQRLVYSEQARQVVRQAVDVTVEGRALPNLKPWREVVTPHQDVSGGQLAMARFAADLWQVSQYPESAPPEYANGIEFFRRTFITEGLHRLLSNAIRRLSGKGGEPVIQLQTNFGGGKTHSMLALYHLCGAERLDELPGLEGVLKEVGISKLSKKVNPVVLVGNRISPGDPSVKEDGTKVRTLWGEIAWQLGGAGGYALVAEADRTSTTPRDDSLRKLFVDHGPCLILIDEWVAYARQLHEEADLPAGSFETHFTFAQELTEVVSTVDNCLLVVSLPASDRPGEEDADLTEVGGQRGMEALHRLRHVVGRKDSPWRSATQEESYEIVRRRLFNTLPAEMYKHRDAVVRAYGDMYRTHAQEFPAETLDPRYEKRLRDAYPIHPELFDELYNSWGSLVRFQRTRGVLRLMAAVIHYLWENQDNGLMIHPAHVPVNAVGVRDALANYLEENWVAVIDKDVDGPDSTPVQVDRKFASQLGRYSATRRVGRSLFLATAPLERAANKGVDEARVKLATVQPGETVAIFSDALKKLTNQATYLYTDGINRYWYSTTPSLNSLAEDESERLKKRHDLLHEEIRKRLDRDFAMAKIFDRAPFVPDVSSDIPDELMTRLIGLRPDCPHQKSTENSPARKAAEDFLANRGTSPRQYKNTLIFVAPDSAQIQHVEESVCKFLAWNLIKSRKSELDLGDNQLGQVDSRIAEAEREISARLREAYCWLLTPEQIPGRPEMIWNEFRLKGSASIPERVQQRLGAEGSLCRRLTSHLLKEHLEKIPLFREGDHVRISTLVEDYAKYLYLPKLMSPDVLLDSINEGISQINWAKDAFAYADGYDEKEERYIGLHVGGMRMLDPQSNGLVVRAAVAETQFQKEREQKGVSDILDATSNVPNLEGSPSPFILHTTSETPNKVVEYHGSAKLDPVRMAREVARISEELIQHLQNSPGAHVRLSLDISASCENGFGESVIRTVTENGVTLKVDGGFE